MVRAMAYDLACDSYNLAPSTDADPAFHVMTSAFSLRGCRSRGSRKHARLCALVFLLSGGCRVDDDVVTLKLAHGLPSTHPVHLGMEYMAERLVEKSGGEMRMEIYPSEQLGSERQTLELLQIGSLDVTKVSASLMEGFVSSFRLFGLPFLFEDESHLHRVLESDVGRELLLEGESKRFRGLTYYDAGGRSFYTTNRQVLARPPISAASRSARRRA
jgi:TRAP-type C4-dicarboxylate transport system substrate-binding protein